MLRTAWSCKTAVMRTAILVIMLGLLAGCGAESVGAAAASAAIKKQELQQAQRTLEQSKQKIGQAIELQNQRGGQE